MKKRILLEGSDDEAVIGNLLFNYELDIEFELKNKKESTSFTVLFRRTGGDRPFMLGRGDRC